MNEHGTCTHEPTAQLDVSDVIHLEPIELPCVGGDRISADVWVYDNGRTRLYCCPHCGWWNPLPSAAPCEHCRGAVKELPV